MIRSIYRIAAVLMALFLAQRLSMPPTHAESCNLRTCPPAPPTVETGQSALDASYFEQRGSYGYASNSSTPASLHTWRLLSQCDITDSTMGGCGRQQTCPIIPGRLLAFYVAQSRRLVPDDHSSVDGQVPPPSLTPGTPFGPWTTAYAGCVDVTDLNPAPTPDEVFRYFRTLPLPHLVAQQQPPGNALVGLPVIFFTQSPTRQNFTLDIRGFHVTIDATASGFTWHTGDGTDLASTGPGAPYPHQTVTHEYRAGTYTASLTTTWSATYTVNGGAALAVPGTTTTDGPPVTFTVLQAKAVLTNPYD